MFLVKRHIIFNLAYLERYTWLIFFLSIVGCDNNASFCTLGMLGGLGKYFQDQSIDFLVLGKQTVDPFLCSFFASNVFHLFLVLILPFGAWYSANR